MEFTNQLTITNMKIEANTEYLITRDYDSKTWEFAGLYNQSDADSYPDSTEDRAGAIFTEKEADRLNNLMDGDGCLSHVGIIKTVNGYRFVTY